MSSSSLISRNPDSSPLAIMAIFQPVKSSFRCVNGWYVSRCVSGSRSFGQSTQTANQNTGKQAKKRLSIFFDGWHIEAYHNVPFGYRGLKQFTSIEYGQYRLEVSQHYHIGLSICACVRLKVNHPVPGSPSLKPKPASLEPLSINIRLSLPSEFWKHEFLVWLTKSSLSIK